MRSLLFLFLFIVSVVPAEASASLGFHLSGIGLGRPVSRDWSVEGRFYRDDGDAGRLSVLGLRGDRRLSPRFGVTPYVGVEADHLSFRRGAAEGDGLGLSAHAGGEAFLSPRLSFQLDAGPGRYWVRRKSAGARGGWDLVVSAGVRLHFP